MSEKSIALSVFFKQSESDAPSVCTPRVRQRLESSDSMTDSPAERMFLKHERAELNRTHFMDKRVRTLSEADELRLQKLEKVTDEQNSKAQRIQDAQCRAMVNRHRFLSQRSSRLKRRHSLIENQVNFKKGDEQEARNQLSIVFEKRGRQIERKRLEKLSNVAKRAGEFNKKVDDINDAKMAEIKRKEELRQQWEQKIERAREKRLKLLQLRKHTT
jgi:hypothetical protein